MILAFLTTVTQTDLQEGLQKQKNRQKQEKNDFQWQKTKLYWNIKKNRLKHLYWFIKVLQTTMIKLQNLESWASPNRSRKSMAVSAYSHCQISGCANILSHWFLYRRGFQTCLLHSSQVMNSSASSFLFRLVCHSFHQRPHLPLELRWWQVERCWYRWCHRKVEVARFSAF